MAITSPFTIKHTLSASITASFKSWVTWRAVKPISSLQFLISSINLSLMSTSKFENGSSKSKTSGSIARALAIASQLTLSFE